MVKKRINNDFDLIAQVKNNGVPINLSEYEITSVRLTRKYSGTTTEISNYEVVNGSLKVHITPILAPRTDIYTLIVTFRKPDATLDDGYWNYESDKIAFRIVGSTDDESGGDAVISMDIAMAIKGDKGDAFTFDDFTPEQLLQLKGEKGDAFTYEDFTQKQLLALKGEKGDTMTYDSLTDLQKQELKDALIQGASETWIKKW